MILYFILIMNLEIEGSSFLCAETTSLIWI
jgi:hypothetical protein